MKDESIGRAKVPSAFDGFCFGFDYHFALPGLVPVGYYARSGRAAVKLHVLLSLRGHLPAWAVVTHPRSHHRTLSAAMAGGIVFQMDEAALAIALSLRPQPERCVLSNMVCDMRIPNDGDFEKTGPNRQKSQR